eukprot:s4134_g9.t1
MQLRSQAVRWISQSVCGLIVRGGDAAKNAGGKAHVQRGPRRQQGGREDILAMDVQMKSAIPVEKQVSKEAQDVSKEAVLAMDVQMKSAIPVRNSGV